MPISCARIPRVVSRTGPSASRRWSSATGSCRRKSGSWKRRRSWTRPTLSNATSANESSLRAPSFPLPPPPTPLTYDVMIFRLPLLPTARVKAHLHFTTRQASSRAPWQTRKILGCSPVIPPPSSHPRRLIIELHLDFASLPRPSSLSSTSKCSANSCKVRCVGVCVE